MFKCTLLLLPLSIFASIASAQDSHYWNNQFGPRSTLLGGSDVGSNRDTSAGYYNPGALGFITNPSLSVSANAYRYDKVTVENGVGTDDSLDSDEILVIPLMLSGVLKFESLPDDVFGYQVLTRNRASFKASQRRDEIIDVLQNPFTPGPEDYIGQFSSQSDLTEVWGGLSWAHKLSDKVSVGFTNFLALRNQKEDNSVLVRAVNPQTFVTGAVDGTSIVDYDNLRLLWKFGMAADLDPLKLGFTFTTPSVNLAGTGTVARDFTVNTVDINSDGVPDSFVADDRQESLDSEFRTPFSVAYGMEYGVSEDWRVDAAVEWFGGQGYYNVMEPESRDFLRPTGTNLFNSSDFLLVTSGADAVTNFALGVEHDFTDTVKGIASFRTDMESLQGNDSPGLSIGASNWDIYHITLGALVKGKNSEFGGGLVYSFGRQGAVEQPVSFANPTEGGFLTGETGGTSIDYDSLGIIVGYTYFLD